MAYLSEHHACKKVAHKCLRLCFMIDDQLLFDRTITTTRVLLAIYLVLLPITHPHDRLDEGDDILQIGFA